MRKHRRGRALAAGALALAVLTGALGLLVMADERRHPAVSRAPTAAEEPRSTLPEASELRPLEWDPGVALTR